MMARLEATELAATFDAHAAGLVLYARQWLKAPLAEDVVQEVFLRLAVLEHPPENLRAWLLTCVRNGAIDSLRRHRREMSRDQRAREARLLDPRAANLEAQMEAGEIAAALQRLPAFEREIVTLRIWNAATFEEIAMLVKLPVSTVHQRYHGALEQLRTLWEVPCPKK